MHLEPSTILVDESEQIVLSYDLAFGGIGDWIVEVQTNLNLPKMIQAVYHRQLLLATNGKLLSLDNVVQHESVGYVYQSGQWMKLNASIDKTSESYLPIYAIPYIVRV